MTLRAEKIYEQKMNEYQECANAIKKTIDILKYGCLCEEEKKNVKKLEKMYQEMIDKRNHTSDEMINFCQRLNKKENTI